MKSLMTFIVVVIVLSAIASVFYGGYLALVYIWQLFDSMDSTLRLILLSSFTVFLLGCLIIAGALKSAAQSKLKAQLSEAKIALYKTIVEVYETYFSALQDGIKAEQQQALHKLQAKAAELNVVAGSAVIECYRKLDQSILNHESENSQSSQYQQLIKKMRQDLGHTPNLDETRLKFLTLNKQTAETASHQHEVSV
jgi:hypothetical protein